MLKIGPLILITEREVNLPENDLAGAIRTATLDGMTAAVLPLREDIVSLRCQLETLRKALAQPPRPHTGPADATAPDATAINQDMVHALMAADAYLHAGAGPLTPEAAALCAQIVNAVDAALTGGAR